MHKYILLGTSLICLFILSSSKDQSFQKNDDLILWKATRPLTWDNFKGKPDEKSKYRALTFVEISSIPLSYNNDSIIYDIPCYFISNQSWTKSKSAALLRHEQLHFDIAELVTRKILSDYSTHQLNDLEKSYIILDRIFKKYGNKDRDSINKKYDSETNHGVIAEKQQQWEVKIAAELKKLDHYASSKVIVRRTTK